MAFHREKIKFSTRSYWDNTEKVFSWVFGWISVETETWEVNEFIFFKVKMKICFRFNRFFKFFQKPKSKSFFKKSEKKNRKNRKIENRWASLILLVMTITGHFDIVQKLLYFCCFKQDRKIVTLKNLCDVFLTRFFKMNI